MKNLCCSPIEDMTRKAKRSKKKKRRGTLCFSLKELIISNQVEQGFRVKTSWKNFSLTKRKTFCRGRGRANIDIMIHIIKIK